MSKRQKQPRAERRVVVSGARRPELDVRKLARVLIQIARAEEEAERQAVLEAGEATREVDAS